VGSIVQCMHLDLRVSLCSFVTVLDRLDRGDEMCRRWLQERHT
jgi:hypothetical protein